ncbi:hypothetical protein G6706_03105, partial [Polynucleobacter paneuropaeus]|nr:hypothetical protein [Polynucleobacter paneuropaeus]
GSAMITASNSYNVAMTNSAIATLSSAVSLAGASSSVGLVVNSADNTGVLLLTAANTFSGSITINGGVVRISADNQLGSISSFNASAITLNGGLIEATQTLTLSSYRGITLGSSDGGLAAASGATLTYGGVITDGRSTNNLKINELGQAGTVKLTGANTFGGDTTIYAGTLVISSDGALGSTSGSFFYLTAGTIGLAGGTLEASNSLTLNSNRNITLSSSNGGLAASAGANLTYDGVIADGSATKSLVINGAGQSGTVTLSGANTYSGDTTVNGGTLVLANGGSLGNVNSTLYLNNATLDLQTSLTLQSLMMQGNSAGITNSIGNSSIQVKGTSTLIGSITTSGTQTYTGSVTLAGDVTLNTSDAMLTVGYIYGNGFNFTTNSGAGNQSMGGGENINTLTLDPIDLSMFFSWFSDNNYNYSYSNNSYATVTQRGPFSAKSLLMYGYADFELTNSGNQFGMVAGSGTYSVNLNAQSDIHVGIVSWKGKSYQGIDSFNSVSLYSSQGDLYVDSGAYVSTSRSGGNIYLNTENRFINNGGSNSVRPYSGANWSVYSDNPDNDYFGGLNSGWNANWGGAYGNQFNDGHNHYNFKSYGTLVITAQNATMVYGSPVPTLTFKLSGSLVSCLSYGNVYTTDSTNLSRIFSDTPNLQTTATSTSSVLGGPYVISVVPKSWTLANGVHANVSLVSGILIITPAPLGIAVTGTYNGTTTYTTLGGSTISLSGLVGGDFGGTASIVTVNSPNVGSGNYVTGVTPSITNTWLASNYLIYGGNATGSSGKNNGGVYSGTITGGANTGGTNTVTITPKAITLTNNPSSTTYDGVSSYATLIANAGYTRTDLVGSDAIGSVTQTASILGNPVTGVAQAGSFTSTPSAAVLSIGNANNYSFSYVGANNTVAKANLTITAVESLTGNPYKGSAYTGTYTTTALGTDASAITVTGQASGVDAGTYTSSLVASGAVLANYNTPSISNANLTITPKAITLTNNPSSTTYDGVSSYATLIANAGYTRTDLVGSDAIGSVTQTASILGNPVTGVAQAGSFTSTPSAAVLSIGNANNYSFSYVGANNTVAKANLTITAVESLTGNPYKGSAYTGTYTTTALGTDASAITVTGQASGVDAGTYTSSLVASGAVLANYNTPVVTNANFVISPAPIGIELVGTYSGTRNVTPSSFVVTGLIDGENINSILSANLAYAGVSANGTNYVTSITGVSGTAVMKNYYITTNYNPTPNTSTTNAAKVNPAILIITAANDAKFITQSDEFAYANNCGVGVACTGNYMGVTYNGFVNGENQSVLTGTPSVIRTNAGVNAAGSYPGVLQASGLSASNYNTRYVNGDYIIVPANALLVRVTPSSRTYGSDPVYAASAQYLASDNSTIVDLVPSISGSAINVVDGVGGTANFNLALVGAVNSTSGNTNVGGYNLTAINSLVTGNNFKSLMVVGSNTVIPYSLHPNQLGISGVSKIYDGNINIGGLVVNVDPTLSSVLGTGATKDLVNIIGSGTFDNPNVGTSKTIDISLALSGTDGGNYVLSANTYSANIGTITQLASVSYVGTAGGNWSNQSNWAGGAIPILNNVANVYIPSGSSVVYDVATVNAAGAMTSNIINNGTLTMNESVDTTIANTLSGAGTYAQTGSGVLTISGNNSQSSPGAFSGVISIASGKTLLLDNADALGNGSILSNGGRVGITPDVILRSLSITGPVNLLTDITTVGNQTYAGAVSFSNGSAIAPMNISSQNGSITFLSDLNSDNANRSLTLNALSGKATLTGTTGYLSPSRFSKSADIYSLTINAKDILLAGDIFTLNSQVYNGAVVISDNGLNGMTRTFVSQDPSISFLGTIDDSITNTHTLNLKAISFVEEQIPTISFGGAIGSIAPLAALNVTLETRLDTDPSPIKQGTPSGIIEIKDDITTVGGQTFTGGGVDFSPTPSGRQPILTSKNGVIEYFGPAGSGNPLAGHTNDTSGSVGGRSSSTYLPPLDPESRAFYLASNAQDGDVAVAIQDQVIPCESKDESECNNN